MKKIFIKLLILVLIIQINFNLIDIMTKSANAATEIYLQVGETYSFTSTTPQYTLSESSIVSVQTDSYAEAFGNRGTNSSYSGAQVDLSNCLYTFTGSGSSYRIAAGSTYLSLPRTGNFWNYQYHVNSTSATDITVTNSNGNFRFNKTTGSIFTTTYNLYFNTSNNYFTSNTNTSNTGTNYTFQLYRPITQGETSSSEIPGYIKATSITSGQKYLIVYKNGNNYYAVYPSTSTSTDYDQTVKINKNVGTDYTVTATSLGTTTLTVDGNEYLITVYDGNVLLEPDSKFNEKALTIGMGTTYTINTNVSGMTWVSNDTSIATVSSAGVVTPVSVGETTLTATYNGMRYRYRVRVIDGGTSGSLINVLIDTDSQTTPYYNPSFGSEFYELINGERVYGYLSNSTYQGVDFWGAPKNGCVLSYINSGNGYTQITQDTPADLQNNNCYIFLQEQANNIGISSAVAAVNKALELNIEGVDGFRKPVGSTGTTATTMVFRSEQLSANITQEVYSINGTRYNQGDKAESGDTVIFAVTVSKNSTDEYQVNYTGTLSSSLNGAVFLGTSPTGTGTSSTQSVTLSSTNPTSQTYYIKYTIPNSVSANITDVASFEYSTYAEEGNQDKGNYQKERGTITASATVEVEGIEKAYITINKKVEGNMRETDKYFKFLVTINGPNGATYRISGQDSTVNYNNSQITTSSTYTVGNTNYIYLKGGQTVTIGLDPNRMIGIIPIGITYSIVEQDSEDYATTISGIQGVTKSTGNLTTVLNNNLVEYTNSRDSAALTGVTINVAAYGIIIIISVLMLSILIILNKKKM